MPDQPSKESLERVKASDATMLLRELFASCLNGSRLVSRDFQRDLMALIPQFRRAIEKIEDESDSLRQQNAALVEALRETLACLLHFDPCTPRTRKAISNAKDALAPYTPVGAPEKEKGWLRIKSANSFSVGRTLMGI